jgi:hypothetical protein
MDELFRLLIIDITHIIANVIDPNPWVHLPLTIDRLQELLTFLNEEDLSVYNEGVVWSVVNTIWNVHELIKIVSPEQSHETVRSMEGYIFSTVYQLHLTMDMNNWFKEQPWVKLCRRRSHVADTTDIDNSLINHNRYFNSVYTAMYYGRSTLNDHFTRLPPPRSNPRNEDCNICLEIKECHQYCTCSFVMCFDCMKQVCHSSYKCPQCRQSF